MTQNSEFRIRTVAAGKHQVIATDETGYIWRTLETRAEAQDWIRLAEK